MRGRFLVMVPLAAFVVAVFAFGSALFATPSHTATDRSGVIVVDVSHLSVGGMIAKHVAIPGLQQARRPVFVVHPSADRYLALFGRSPHLGCKIVTPGDPDYEPNRRVPADAFEDPCDGAYFTRSGVKISGPSPRGLDRFAMSVSDGEARIDLNILIPGPPPAP